jgi:hypothetical protein
VRQCGDVVLRKFRRATRFERCGMPHRIVAISVPVSVLRMTGAG